MSDLREASERGLIDRAPHYNTIFKYLEKPELTPVLTNLITESSLPLQSVETDFAVDSSGFSASRFERWYNHKYGKDTFRQEWVKCHIITGVKTNIITGIEILDKNAADVKQLPPLVAATAQNFRLSEVSGDKAYLSVKNVTAIHDAGALPFIAFKKDSSERGKTGHSKVWKDMFYYFMWKHEDFLQHYHKRSNVETTFSMLKRKFGDSVRSKTDIAMKNEVLCKVLAHNLVVLIHEIHELGIEPVFWKQS